MTTLSLRPIEEIGFNPPKGANPEDHELCTFSDNESEEDNEVPCASNDEQETDDSDYDFYDTETSSEVSECELNVSTFVLPKRNNTRSKVYKVVLQEEEFLPE